MVSVRWAAVWSLASRELKRFVRQRNRVFGALAQPVLFWALFGSGLDPSFRAAGRSNIGYVEYFFPGIVILTLLFTAIFTTISIIEDRNNGFLQSVLIAPIDRSTIVCGKVLGTTILAVGQAALVLALAPVSGLDLSIPEIASGLALLVLIAVGLAGLGFSIAWRMDSTQGFHAIMTAFLMPMWFLSGAFFPAAGLPTWLATLVMLNPLTYGVAAFRRVLYWSEPSATQDLPSLGASLLVVIVFAAAMMSLATWIARDRKPARAALA
jgi:ABC-2 type transport system permease protein